MSGVRGSIDLSPGEEVLEANQLDQLIQLWLDDCASKLPAYTVDGYKHKIYHFRQWWATIGPGQGWLLHRRDLVDFASYLEGRKLAYNSRKDILRRLRQMFLWALNSRHTDGRNYAVWVPVAEGSAPMRVAAPILSLKKLIDTAGRTSNPGRDRAILAILIGTGIRRAEAAGLNVRDIQLDADNSGTAQIWTAKKVKGREVQSRLIAFDRYTGRYLAEWLATYNVQFGPLFPSAHGGPLSAQGIYKVTKAIIRDAGLDKEIQGPHDLRRAFATHFERKRRGEGHGRLLAKQLGHANYRMTSQYSLQDIEDVREVIVSPFAMLDG